MALGLLNPTLAYNPPLLDVQIITEAPVVAETVEEKIARVSQEHGISTSTLSNLAYSESRMDATAEGDHGCSYGLTQINICVHPEVTREQALDADFNLEWAASRIEEGNAYIYTSCNCYSLVRVKVGSSLPSMAAIQPNSAPQIGGVAIFYYHDNETGKIVKHVAVITAVGVDSVTIFEANYAPCKIGARVIPFSDPHLVGFWSKGGL